MPVKLIACGGLQVILSVGFKTVLAFKLMFTKLFFQDTWKYCALAKLVKGNCVVSNDTSSDQTDSQSKILKSEQSKADVTKSSGNWETVEVGPLMSYKDSKLNIQECYKPKLEQGGK